MVERFFFSSSESESEGSDSAVSFAALSPVLGCAAPGVSPAAPALVGEYERLNELEAMKKVIDILQSVLVRVADNIAQLRRAVRGLLRRVEQIVVRPKRNGCIVRDCIDVFFDAEHIVAGLFATVMKLKDIFAPAAGVANLSQNPRQDSMPSGMRHRPSVAEVRHSSCSCARL